MSDRLLIIENEEEFRCAYQKEFAKEGYDVVTVSDDLEALRILKSQNVDLVILDMDLHYETGTDYLQQIVNVKRNVKVVINTYSPIKFSMDFSSWAADALMTKSTNLAKLNNKVHDLLHPI